MTRALRRHSCALALGVLFTTFGAIASAQESVVAQTAARAKASPLDPAVALEHGRALRLAGRLDEAALVLRRAASSQIARTTSAGSPLHWELARVAIDRRDFGQAMVQCRVVMNRPGTKAAGHVCAAEAHLLWRRATEVHAELAHAQRAPGFGRDAQVAAKIAEARARELELDEAAAEAAYRAALHVMPDHVEALVRLGALLQRTGKGGRAELARAVQLAPHDPDARFAIAETERGTARIDHLQRATTERAVFPLAERALALALLEARRVGEAKKVSERVLARDAADVASLLVAGRVALAEARPQDAVTLAERALAAQPNAAAAKLLVGDARAAQGEVDLALEAYQAAWGLDHSSPAPLVRAAAACVEAKRPTSARAFAKKATAEFAKDPSAWLILGDVQLVDGDRAEARASYERAKALGADAEVARKKLEAAR